jgi:outer membrane biosynthesis protein TonB
VSTSVSTATSTRRSNAGRAARSRGKAQDIGLPERLIVTIQGRRASDPAQTLVWECDHGPMGLCHPFTWVLEMTPAGVRVRDVSAAPGVVVTEAPLIVPFSELKSRKSHSLKAESGRTIKLTLGIPSVPKPAFEEFITGSRQGDRNHLRAFHCRGGWILETETVAGSWTASTRAGEVFTVKSGADCEATLKARKDLHWERGEKSGTLHAGQDMSIVAADLGEFSVTLGLDTWRFAPILTPKAVAATLPGAQDPEFKAFQKSLAGAGIAALLFLLICFVWPAPTPETEEEPIPPEFAKVLMQAAPAAPMTAASDTATTAADSAVSQALHSEAVQNAISGLLKTGMTRLLSQSAFTGVNTAGSRSLFAAAAPNTPDLQAQAAQHNAVNVAAVGGGGKEGYAKGSAAGVSGQGTGTLSLDSDGAQVEEGLSKDEVGKVIHAHMNEVRYCYDSALIRSPDVEGKLIISFAIGSKGAVTRSSVGSSSLNDPRLDDCILRRLGHWQFPNPKGGVTVAVSYPFIFKTLGR